MSKKAGNIIESFSPNLFWDVDALKLDVQKNKSYIIRRVIELGTLNDWQVIRKYYGLNTIGKEMQKVRYLDNVSLSFISLVTGINKESFRCYTLKQSTPQHLDF